MAGMVGRRLLKLIPVLLLVSMATMAMLELVPGDPAVVALGEDASPARLEAVRAELGLDQPLHERYVTWLGDLARGDLGRSLVNPARSVGDLIRQSLPITLQLALMGLAMALAAAIPLAMWAAYREGSRFDRLTLAATSALISVPSFLAALLLALLFVFNREVPRAALALAGLAAAVSLVVTGVRRARADGTGVVGPVAAGLAVGAATAALVVTFPELPRTGFSRITGSDGLGANLRSAFLPALTLALTELAVFTRLLRTDMLATLQEDYMLAAKAKGVPVRRLLWHHALRPSSFSLVTLAGVSLGRLIGGTVIVETVFGIPGMGRLIVQLGVIPGDYTIVQAGVLVIAVFYVVINLAVDLSYAYLDPRIRRG
jgi:peptide/nickel transport system permease protein